jgi:hypothetical protein
LEIYFLIFFEEVLGPQKKILKTEFRKIIDGGQALKFLRLKTQIQAPNLIKKGAFNAYDDR